MSDPRSAMTEREKALAGLTYNIMDPELIALREAARRAIYAYNRSDPMEADPPSPLLRQLLGDLGAGSVVVKDVPAYCVAVGNPATVIREITEERP